MSERPAPERTAGSRLTTRSAASGVLVVRAGQSRVGYVVPRDDREHPWMWELNMTSDQLRGHPRGIARTSEEAVVGLEHMLTRWMRAAGMEWKR